MKKIKLIIPICLAVIMLLAVLLILFVFNGNNKIINQQSPQIIYNMVTVDVAEDIKTVDMDKRIKEILDLSYKYYLLSSGNVEVNKNKSITKGLKKYNSVTLDGIKNEDDINKLVEDLFVKAFISSKLTELYENKNYIMEDDILYLNIKSPLCSVGYDLSKMVYSYQVLNNVVYVAFSENGRKKFEFQLFNEDGKYKVSAPFYDCRFG